MRVAVVGTTTWGTTLGILLARTGVEVILIARDAKEADRINVAHRNVDRLPDYELPASMSSTADVAALVGTDLVVIAVPSASMRENARSLAPAIPMDAVVVSASKGLERDTSRRMSQVIEEELPSTVGRIAVLSGPNLSSEILDEQPASTVIASDDGSVADRVVAAFMSPSLRAYTNTDVIGVELGGAFKNILAIGAGMSDGLGFGDNAKAGLITRGLAEITRLGVAAGARPLTFAGLAGLGDLIATSSSRLSRNYFLGEQLAKGRPLKVVLEGMRNVAEGVDTTVAALHMAEDLGVEMPIARYTYRVMFEGLEPERAVKELMARSPKPEWTGG